ncbi:hypothetical protein BC938DRAFT_476611 [Jimgerdemannia flammicorona]|uniref:Protein kinase domain-containing protein n=1 Tax=Jimgerdemannia flammicorona TaxID=994334 RepID=A0A433PFQ7_9FUNG|nr:hypothetical protein BC938DRAFT_476611 [Jimgerdemannia flammicorona]
MKLGTPCGKCQSQLQHPESLAIPLPASTSHPIQIKSMNIKEFETTKRLFAKGTICEERKLMIQANKLNFAGHEKELHDQLITLNLLELADYLVWIPMKRFTNIEVLGNGGYSTVYSGTVEWPTGFAASTIHTIRRETGRIRKKYAMKEIDLNMVTEAKAFIATRRQQHAAECSSNAIMERPSAGKDYDMRSQFHTYDSLRKISDMARVDYTKFHDYGSLTRIYSLVEAELKHEQSKSDKLGMFS